MRRLIPTYCCALLLLLLPCLLHGAERLRERVYLSTDSEVYVAGDAVWMSAWCVDAATGALSTFSKIAYVEVHSASGLVQTAKIALNGGRGAGRLILPDTLPTGNYRILCFTRLGASETGFDPLDGARTISVVNTFSADRVPDGVRIVPHAPAAAPAADQDGLEIGAEPAATGGLARIRVTNRGTQAAGFSLRVRHDDGIPAPAGGRIGDFVAQNRRLPTPAGFAADVVPEYEGEIIRARVTGTDEAGRRAMDGKYAFLSSPGSGENLYTEAIAPDGTVTFFTTNIFGSQNMFLEIENPGRDNVCHLEIESPFPDLSPGEIPPLQLSADYAQALELRKLAMQLERNFDADTLYDALPVHEHRVFDERDRTRYILDDYTRFPVMEELFVEFIHEVRVRRVDGRPQIQVSTTDYSGHRSFPQGMALVLLDGIPVPDHAKILAYDPLLVEHIDIYSRTFFFGARSFSGIVNFVTYKGNLPSMQFEDNVRIVDFQGCSLPLAYTCEGVGAKYPDYRQTLYWHPMLSLAPGESMEIECKTPAYSGRFEVFAEGLTAGGQAVSARTALEVVR